LLSISILSLALIRGFQVTPSSIGSISDGCELEWEQVDDQ
jgi:hypothetical protein